MYIWPRPCWKRTILVHAVVEHGIICSPLRWKVKVTAITSHVMLHLGTVGQLHEAAQTPHHCEHIEALNVLLDRGLVRGLNQGRKRREKMSLFIYLKIY